MKERGRKRGRGRKRRLLGLDLRIVMAEIAHYLLPVTFSKTLELELFCLKSWIERQNLMYKYN